MAPTPARNPPPILPPPISITPIIRAPEEEGDDRSDYGDNFDRVDRDRYTSSDHHSQPFLHVPTGVGERLRYREGGQSLYQESLYRESPYRESLDGPPAYDPNHLIPVVPTFRFNNRQSPTFEMASNLSAPPSAMGSENTSPVDGSNDDNNSSDVNANAPNPFNFQTQVISTTPVKPNVGQRRGHKYKHSSISAQHQIFQEPPPRPPLALPRDLPVPTVGEAWRSMSTDQCRRLYWCTCHLLVAVLVLLSAHGSLAMTALSHLVFFDVGSALVCVVVEVLGNFEVWRRSSIRHPFGLERAEVLAGFAMSIFLIFGGFDLVSHNVKHLLENAGGHAAHHPDPHAGTARVSPGSIDVASAAAIAATLVSAYGLRNHARISRIMRVGYLASLPGILSNPFHFLTLSTSFLLVMLPLLSVPIGVLLDSAMCALVALAMSALGLRLAIAQGLMLLMSYGGRPGSGRSNGNITSNNSGNGDVAVADVVREIESEPSVERVDEAQFWQVHYGLCMANLKLSVARGCDDAALNKLRTRISNLIQNRLGEGYGRGGSLRWEVSLQMATTSRS